MMIQALLSLKIFFEGNYFLYAEGFDQNIGMNVIGGSPIQLNSTTIANNELYVTLYVTE